MAIVPSHQNITLEEMQKLQICFVQFLLQISKLRANAQSHALQLRSWETISNDVHQKALPKRVLSSQY